MVNKNTISKIICALALLCSFNAKSQETVQGVKFRAEHGSYNSNGLHESHLIQWDRLSLGLKSEGNRFSIEDWRQGSSNYKPLFSVGINGNVAVGTYDSYQFSKLDVVGSYASNYFDSQLHLHTSNNTYGMFAGSHAAKYGVVSQGGHYYSSNKFTARTDQVTGIIQSNGGIQFFSNSGLTLGSVFTPTHRMVIKDDGNIGIGRTDPQARLDIKGGGNSYSVENFIVRDQYNNKDFVIRGNGSVQIGYDINVPDGYMLGIGGKAIMEEVNVQLKTNWPDYVFSKEYDLKPLSEVADYIEVNQHLPEVPSALEVEESGQNLGEMNAILLKKIEELTLYMIELKEENESLKERIENVEIKMLD